MWQLMQNVNKKTSTNLRMEMPLVRWVCSKSDVPDIALKVRVFLKVCGNVDVAIFLPRATAE